MVIRQWTDNKGEGMYSADIVCHSNLYGEFTVPLWDVRDKEWVREKDGKEVVINVREKVLEMIKRANGPYRSKYIRRVQGTKTSKHEIV